MRSDYETTAKANTGIWKDIYEENLSVKDIYECGLFNNLFLKDVYVFDGEFPLVHCRVNPHNNRLAASKSLHGDIAFRHLSLGKGAIDLT